jgi:hypothetical protein
LQSGPPWRDLPKSFAPGLNRRITDYYQELT